MLAYALGGEVADNPRGLESGTVEVTLNEAGVADRLLGELANPLRVHVSHQQMVITLPIGARLLAWSDRDPHQAFSVGNNVWGVQFHPEFNAAAVRAYTEDDREVLRAEGKDPDQISAQIEETIYGTTILQRFARLALRA